MPFSDWCISILCNRTPLNFSIVRSVQPKRFCHFEFLSWGVFYSRCTCYFSPCLLRVLRTWSNELWTFLKRFSGNFWILDFEKHVYVRTTNSITAIVTEWIFYGLPLFTIWLLDLTFTRLLDSVKYESGTFIADFVSSFVIKGPLDGIYLRNNAGLCVGTLCEHLTASCEEFVFVDQGLYKWMLLASNSGTLYSFCEWLM